MAHNLWKQNPRNWAFMSNRHKLINIAEMLYSLQAVTSGKYKDLSKSLKDMANRVSLKAEQVNKKINLNSLINPVYQDLVYLKDLILEGSSLNCIEKCLAGLNDDLSTLSTFIEQDIGSSPIDDYSNPKVAKFNLKKDSVKSLYRMALRSLEVSKSKRENLSAGSDALEQRRFKIRSQQLNALIANQSDAVIALQSIVEKLDVLTDFANLSPALAKQINRLIKLKPLGDFVYRPTKAKKERDKLNSQLYYIMGNVRASAAAETIWNETLFDTDQNLTEEAVEPVVKSKLETKTEPTVESDIRSNDDPNIDSCQTD